MYLLTHIVKMFGNSPFKFMVHNLFQKIVLILEMLCL